ncbi:MAG: oligoendopeptidase F [Bacillota bacterium]|nr:oligoendopeptidase F [Bacillota bacterium]
MDNNKNALPKRSDISPEFKWKLEDIYPSNDLWEQDFKKVKELAVKLSDFKGHLGDSPEKLVECLELHNLLISINDKVFVYARMRKDEDNTEPVYQAMTDRAMALSTEAYAAISFITPEIISIPEDTLKKFMDQNGSLKTYRFFIDEIIRQKSHILSEREEEILALSAEVAHAPHDIFSAFNNADIKFPFIKDETGEEVEVTKGRYVKFLESHDRRVRQDAFQALYSSYGAQHNTLASMLNNNVKKNRFYASVRKYDSALQSSLDDDNIPVNVYDNLIDTINKNLNLLHRYLKLRKKALKLDELHMYDLYVPIIEMPKKEIPYKEALETVEKGLMPMGDEYIGYLKNAFNSGWLDVYETVGKTSGAYSWGTFKTHPYVLLNYQGTINDVFTIAHEMGHALHSFYTNKTQPFIYSEYKIFVAEVASTVNESLLMRYMLEKTKDKKEKAYLLNHYLEEFRGTVFRQTMFAEFEKIIHANVEQGYALTAQSLSDIYKGLNEKYYGCETVIDDHIKLEWSRIPHFYTSFYVYKYATGFSAATALSQQILKEGKPAVDRYINFLKGGGSDYPLELLKKAGVDLSDPKPVQDGLNVFEETLAELEELV